MYKNAACKTLLNFFLGTGTKQALENDFGIKTIIKQMLHYFIHTPVSASTLTREHSFIRFR